MHSISFYLTDSTLTNILFIETSALAIVGVVASIWTPERLLHKSICVLFLFCMAVLGFIATHEQSARAQREAASEQGKIDGTVAALKSVQSGLSCASISSALNRIRQEASGGKQQLLTGSSQGAHVQGMKLENDALKLSSNLQALLKNWTEDDDSITAAFTKRWSSPDYLTLSPSQREAMIGSDQREIAFRERLKNRQEVAFYTTNYEKAAQAFRLEMFGSVPDSTDLSVDYADPAGDLVSYEIIAMDFAHLTDAYVKALKKRS